MLFGRNTTGLSVIYNRNRKKGVGITAIISRGFTHGRAMEMTSDVAMDDGLTAERRLYKRLRHAGENADIDAFRSALASGVVSKSSRPEIAHAIGFLFTERYAGLLSKADRKFFKEWLDGTSASPEERTRLLAALLTFGCSLYPRRSDPLIELCLEAGGTGFLTAQAGRCEITGVRPAMTCRQMSVLALAIENGYQPIFSRLTAGADLSRVVCQVACLDEAERQKPTWLDVDALSYCVACGQVELCELMIRRMVQLSDAPEQFARCVRTVMSLGLLDEGPDAVLRCVISVIGAGADLDSANMERLREHTMLLRDVKTNEETVGSFLGAVALSAGQPGAASDRDVLRTLSAFAMAGYDLQAPLMTVDEGRSLAHYAALGGSVTVLKYLTERGCSMNVQDNDGIAPLELAQAGENRQAVAYITANAARATIARSEIDRQPTMDDTGAAIFAKLQAMQISAASRFGARP